ncbi:MAG: hypothetical protein JXA90_03635 [Planctomycetes bacterium]|nr:hypothetical protein [Planctomycetota bacterium]
MYRSSLLTAAVLWLLASCSAPDPYSGKAYDDAVSTPVLPYAVRIKEIQFTDVEAEPGAVDDDPAILGVKPARIVDPQNELQMRAKIKDALETYRVFTLVAYDETDFQSRSLTPELEMEVILEARTHLRDFPHEATGMKWWNLFLWLFAGFPGWIIEDMHVDPGVEKIICRLTSTGGVSGGEVFRREIDLADADLLNFMRRAHWKEYLMNIIIPPFLISSDRETADESLFDNYVSRMQSGLSREIKGGLSRHMAGMEGKAPQLLLISPVEVGGEISGPSRSIDVLVFSDEEAETIEVEHIAAGEKPAKILDEELAPVARTQWREKASRVLTGEIDYLLAYGSVFGIEIPDALADLPRGGDGYLRFKVAFSTRTGTVTRTWTAPY